MVDFIEESIESVYSQYEILDSILYDAALEANDTIDEMGRSMNNSIARTTNASGKENVPGDNSRTTGTGNAKKSDSVFARIKRFFAVIIERITIIFNDISNLYKRAAVSDKEFKKKFKDFAKTHNIRTNVTFENGEYKEEVLEATYTALTRFSTSYNHLAKGLVTQYKSLVSANSATEDSLKNTNAKLIELNNKSNPLALVANALRVDADSIRDYKSAVVTIHTLFIGKQSVVRLNTTDDTRSKSAKIREAERYVQDAVAYLDRYANHQYKRMQTLVKNIENDIIQMKKVFEGAITLSSNKVQHANVLTKRVSELVKHNTTCINLIKYCGSCYIEKAINCRLIVQRAYGF